MMKITTRTMKTLATILLLGSSLSAQAALNGFHDGASCTWIVGWAWDSAQPTTSKSVDIYDGSTLLATVVAGNFRQDLLNAGIGNGYHGFAIATPAAVINGQSHTITVKYAGTQTNLNTTPKTLSCIAPGVPTPVYDGSLDSANCTSFSGWAWDSQQPNGVVSVDLYDGNTLLTTVAANVFRQDLLNAGKGNGVHGFEVPLPASVIDNLPHTISAKYAGTQTGLTLSPKTVSCLAPGIKTPVYNGNHETTNCTAIGGWAWDSNRPATPISVDIYDGSTLLTTVTAGTFRQDLLNAGIGNGSHGFALATPGVLKNGQPHTITIKYAGSQISLPSSPKTATCVSPVTVSLSSPANNAVTVAPGSFTLSANATSAASTIAKVDFYAATTGANGTTTNTLVGTATTATAGAYNFTWANVPAGSYSITAIATDTLGATATSAATAVTAVANVPPTIALTSPTNGSTASVPGSFTLTATATSTTSSIAKVDFYANNGTTNTLIGTTTTAGNGSYSFNWGNVTLGNYMLSAVATDTLNATTTSSQVSVTVNSGIAQAYYIHADQLDTPRVITDTAGNTVWQWDNGDPFGNNPPNENPSGLGTFEFNKRYDGQYFDRETGTHYNFFRDCYDPATGRYCQPDPIGLYGGSSSLYPYVNGNPLSRIDPLGLYESSPLLSGIPGQAAGDRAGTAFLNGDYGTAALQTGLMLSEQAVTVLTLGSYSRIKQVAKSVKYWCDASNDTPASTPKGRRGSPMDVADGTNSPATIGGRDYSGHALDQMQGRGITPSVVEDAIANGVQSSGNTTGTVVSSSGANGVSVVTNSQGRVVTVITTGRAP